MKKFLKHQGLTVSLYQNNIDTDQILPKQFLKRIERSGFGEFLFYDRRYNSDGTPNTEFVLNQPQFKDASILLTGKNFGCGSSREHAPWALEDFGFKVIIAPSFADIFFNNCFKIGLLPIVIDEEKILQMIEKSQVVSDYSLLVDLENEFIVDSTGSTQSFTVDEFQRFCLLNGLDEIGLTLQFEEKISLFEQNRPLWKNLSV